MIAGLGRFTLIAEQRVLSPSKTVSGNLMKRCVPVFTLLAVVKVSLRLVYGSTRPATQGSSLFAQSDDIQLWVYIQQKVIDFIVKTE